MSTRYSRSAARCTASVRPATRPTFHANRRPRSMPRTDGLRTAARVLPLLIVACALIAWPALAHDVSEADRAKVQGIDGPAFIPFLYLGAKHMVTGYDHVAFLIGVAFYLRRLRDVVIYVSMSPIGPSLPLLGGVRLGTGANPYVVDAIIGVSVIYKAVENLGGFRKLGIAINTKLAVLVFGLFH